MEFQFFNRKRKSVPNVNKPDVPPTDSAKFSQSTEAGSPIASPELEAAVNAALEDVNVSCAETMHRQFYSMAGQVISQISEVINQIAGREVQRVMSTKGRDHIVVGFGDGSAISIKFSTSTLKEIDRLEGERRS